MKPVSVSGRSGVEEGTTSRRQFLQSVSTAAAVTGLAPFFVHASNKSGNRELIVGAGEQTYRCLHNWGRESLPENHNYGTAAHGTAIDSQGLIYISHYGTPGCIFVFDPEGRFVRSLGKIHAGKGHGIDIRREGSEEFLYLAPSESHLAFAKMTLQGEMVWQKGRKELNRDSGVYENPKTAFRPTNTSFRPDGGYYLGDGYGSHYLFEYDKNDRFVRTLGGPGEQPGQFRTPHGHWLDERDGTPKLVVADRANKRLQWFDMAGNPVQTLEGFLYPASIDIQGDLMLVPDLHARITILDKQNRVLAQLGDDESWREQVLADKLALRKEPARWQPGKFVHPHDACFDAAGNIYVAEWVVTGRVTKLEKVR